MIFSSDVNRDVHLAGESFGSGSRRAVFVGDLERRPGDLLADVGLSAAGHTLSYDRQPPRRGVGLIAGLLREALTLQQFADAPRQFVPRAVDHSGGNFFGTDFEKEVRHKGELAISY